MAESSKHTILIVDDEEEILHSLQGLLRAEFEVYTAQNGFEALELLQRQAIHVLLCDQRMPEMSGVQLLSQVQQTHPEIRRIMFSGYADIRAVIDAINQGRISRYIRKPWDPDEMLAVLRLTCQEYEQLAVRNRLIADFRSRLTHGLQLIATLQQEASGTLSPTSQAAIKDFIEQEHALLDRLDRELTSEYRKADV